MILVLSKVFTLRFRLFVVSCHFRLYAIRGQHVVVSMETTLSLGFGKEKNSFSEQDSSPTSRYRVRAELRWRLRVLNR